jgi:hypothetical protein
MTENIDSALENEERIIRQSDYHLEYSLRPIQIKFVKECSEKDAPETQPTRDGSPMTL